MTRRVSAGVNAIVGRWLPEQRLFAKTDDRTRFVRLSPITQLAGAACIAALIGWTGYLTIQKLSGVELDTQLVATDQRIVEIYEARIARLEDDRRRIADRLSESLAETSLAAKTAAQTHQSLGDALADAKMLTSTKTSHQQQIEQLAAVQLATLDRCNALDAQLTFAKAEKSRLDQLKVASDTALSDVTTVLDQTAEARDQAKITAARLTQEVATLKSDFELRRDQQKRLMERLEDAARLSLGSLETVFDKTGVDLDKVLAVSYTHLTLPTIYSV